MRQEGNFPPVGAAVATLCPFLLPPIRRHRSVIRNCVSLSSPCRIEAPRLYERLHAILCVFLFPYLACFHPVLSFSLSLFFAPSIIVYFLSVNLWFRCCVSFPLSSRFFRVFSPSFSRICETITAWISICRYDNFPCFHTEMNRPATRASRFEVLQRLKYIP